MPAGLLRIAEPMSFVRPSGPLRVNNGEAMLPSIITGIGIGMLPEFHRARRAGEQAGGDLAARLVLARRRGLLADAARWAKTAASHVPPGPIGIAINFNTTMPKYILTFGAGKSWDDFEFDVQGKWVSKSKDWTPVWAAKTFVNVPDYMTMNARVGYRPLGQLHTGRHR